MQQIGRGGKIIFLLGPRLRLLCNKKTDELEKNKQNFNNMHTSCIHGRDPGKQELPKMVQAITFTPASARDKGQMLPVGNACH